MFEHVLRVLEVLDIHYTCSGNTSTLHCLIAVSALTLGVAHLQVLCVHIK